MKIPRKMKKHFKKDDGCFSTSIWAKDGLLPISIHCIISCASGRIFKHYIPRLRFANNYSDGSPDDPQNCIVMTLNGKILFNRKLNISNEDVNILKQWVFRHKRALLRHFECKTSSFELLREVGL